MSGLLALLDDVAGIAKIAAASVDDVAGQAAKAGSKVAGVVIDDAAVTPKYVTGFEARRELPMIWKITRGSLFNKIVVLLPALLLLNAFAPWFITPLLMIGGAYLCFEGAEKVFHWLFPHQDAHVEQDLDIGDPLHLEETRVKGAIKTDFILSAEIMTIILANIEAGSFWFEASTLAVAGVAVTILVYGSVALIVKMDDIGVWIAENGLTGISRSFGRGLVKGMPVLLKTLTIVGTAAMLWVGGSIILHGMQALGLPYLYDQIHHIAVAVAGRLGEATGFLEWAVTAFLDGVFGLALGMVLIPVVTRVLAPLARAVGRKRKAAP
jgi:predicted DNA repair protein MutK